MPVIEVHLLEGYNESEHRRLSEALTDASRLVVPAPAEAITVMIHSMAAQHYMRGREAKQPASALPDPCKLVHQFLDCLASRDLDSAASFLAESFQMIFPGTAPMSELSELVSWSSGRYRKIAKTFERTEAFANASGTTVVVCNGTLSGVWPDGSTFKNIRFIDRFEILNGKIVLQEVWNDLAETRAHMESVNA